mmetsp:Transcript_86231/g.249021  ORF Transcript_86231/g.249021 Transcript_86231/m.249021 type:complete len:202 (+) Transcript_86231:2491-3096(+)
MPVKSACMMSQRSKTCFSMLEIWTFNCVVLSCKLLTSSLMLWSCTRRWLGWPACCATSCKLALAGVGAGAANVCDPAPVLLDEFSRGAMPKLARGTDVTVGFCRSLSPSGQTCSNLGLEGLPPAKGARRPLPCDAEADIAGWDPEPAALTCRPSATGAWPSPTTTRCRSTGVVTRSLFAWKRRFGEPGVGPCIAAAERRPP